MTDEEYKKTQNRIFELAAEVDKIDVKGFLERIREAESCGWFVDPTAMKAAQKNLNIIKKLAEGLFKFQKDIPDLDVIIEGAIDAQKYREMRAVTDKIGL